MATLGWSIQNHDRLVVVSGLGVFDLPFFLAYLQAMHQAGTIGYCKFFDLRQADIRLSGDDLASIGNLTRQPGATSPGPVAVLVGRNPPPLMLDMAILLKQHVGTSRRFRLFTDESEARRWLVAVST